MFDISLSWGLCVCIWVVICVNFLSIGFINGEWNVCEIVNWCICWFCVVNWFVIVFVVVCVLEIIIDLGVLIVVIFIFLFSSGFILFLLVVIVIIVLFVGSVCINWFCVIISIVVFVNVNILVVCVVVSFLMEWFMMKFGSIF